MIDPRFRENFDKALALRNSGNLSDSLQVFELLAEEYPNSGMVFTFMGDVCQQLDLNDQAIEYFRRATELDPSVELASLSLFHALWDEGDQVGALDEMKRFLKIKKSDEYTFILEGIKEDLKKSGDWD